MSIGVIISAVFILLALIFIASLLGLVRVNFSKRPARAYDDDDLSFAAAPRGGKKSKPQPEPRRRRAAEDEFEVVSLSRRMNADAIPLEDIEYEGEEADNILQRRIHSQDETLYTGHLRSRLSRRELD